VKSLKLLALLRSTPSCSSLLPSSLIAGASGRVRSPYRFTLGSLHSCAMAFEKIKVANPIVEMDGTLSLSHVHVIGVVL
jgi:hypothetical protein